MNQFGIVKQATNGGSDDYTATITGWISGGSVYFGTTKLKFVGDNGGPSTLSVNGATPVEIKKLSGSSLVDLEAGDIVDGYFYDVTFNDTDFVIEITSVADASSSVKGIAKLYPSTSLGTNTDGAPDQNAVKAYVDAAVAGATIANASETVAGKVEEATDAEMQAGTAIGGTGAKLFSTPAKLGTWWTWLKTQAQTFADLTATALKVSGQAAASGKKNGVLILDDGTIQKVSWVEHDTTNRTITEQGVDDLVATTLHEWKNSSGSSILKILNGQQVVVGGSTFVIEVGATITSGNARVRFNDNQAMSFIFEDVNGKEHLSFKSTDSDERINISVPQRFRPLIATTTDANIDRNVLRFTSGNTNGATQTVGSVSIPSDETNAIVWVKWQAIANDGTAGWGKLMHGVQRISGSTVQAVGTQDDGDGIQRTAGDFTMALVANNTSKAVDLNFTNNSSGAKVFKITAVIEWLIVDEPI